VWSNKYSVPTFPLSDVEKYAYRYLLYAALLDIRGIGYARSADTSSAIATPYLLLAEWLHNLALFSARDFANFSPEIFWREYEVLVRPHLGQVRCYREIFLSTLPSPPSANALKNLAT
jgi:hypothetical protein